MHFLLRFPRYTSLGAAPKSLLCVSASPFLRRMNKSPLPIFFVWIKDCDPHHEGTRERTTSSVVAATATAPGNWPPSFSSGTVTVRADGPLHFAPFVMSYPTRKISCRRVSRRNHSIARSFQRKQPLFLIRARPEFKIIYESSSN